MILRVAITLLLAVNLLAGCSGGGPQPSPSPTPLPPPSPAPSFVAAFASPSMGVAGLCDRYSPITCSFPDGAVWSSNNFPGNGGAGCVDPNPNVCYSVTNGVLTTDASDPGFPLITTRTFDRTKTIHVHMRSSVVCGSEPGGWGGIVIDDGEPDYRAEYWICNATGVEVHNYADRVEVPLSAERYPEGSVHDFDMLWRPNGTIEFKVDGVTKLIETSGSIGPDSTTLAHDPHVSIFSGAEFMSVYGLEVFEEAP